MFVNALDLIPGGRSKIETDQSPAPASVPNLTQNPTFTFGDKASYDIWQHSASAKYDCLTAKDGQMCLSAEIQHFGLHPASAFYLQ